MCASQRRSSTPSRCYARFHRFECIETVDIDSISIDVSSWTRATPRHHIKFLPERLIFLHVSTRNNTQKNPNSKRLQACPVACNARTRGAPKMLHMKVIHLICISRQSIWIVCMFILALQMNYDAPTTVCKICTFFFSTPGVMHWLLLRFACARCIPIFAYDIFFLCSSVELNRSCFWALHTSCTRG